MKLTKKVNMHYSDGRHFENIEVNFEAVKSESSYGTGLYTHMTIKNPCNLPDTCIPYDTRYCGTKDINKLADICLNTYCGEGNWDYAE